MLSSKNVGGFTSGKVGRYLITSTNVNPPTRFLSPSARGSGIRSISRRSLNIDGSTRTATVFKSRGFIFSEDLLNP